MSLTIKREPRNLSDPNIWAQYELVQFRQSAGICTPNLYDDSGSLKITKGKIGIDDGVEYGTISISTIGTIDISSVTSENWAKIEVVISNKIPIFTAIDISGETDVDNLPSVFTNAYSELKNGYYITATKRTIGLIYIDSDGNIYIINVNSLTEGYYSNRNYDSEDIPTDILYPKESSLKNKSLININMGQFLKGLTYGVWNHESSAADLQWFGVSWSPDLGLFCAVASSGTGNRVMTSPDGINWTSRTSASDDFWRLAAWSPSLTLFAAIGTASAGSGIMTSPDGTTWTNRTNPQPLNDWHGICWSPELSLFVAVAYGGTNRAMTSSNGTSWTSHSCPVDYWRSVCWSPELALFCAVAYNTGSGSVMTSPDGINWTARTSAEANDWGSVCWSPKLGLFCAITHTGTNRVQTSPDGVNWTARACPSYLWRSVCWSEEIGVFCAVSSSGNLMTSRYGTHWEVKKTIANEWYSVCYSPELARFCATSITGTGDRAMTSLIIE